MNDPYETLGVSRNAPASVIKAAYKARIRETHPDAGGDAAAAKAVNDAYDLLMDPSRLEAWQRTQPAEDSPNKPTSSSTSSSSNAPRSGGTPAPPRPAPDTRTAEERRRAWKSPLPVVYPRRTRVPRSWRWVPWVWVSAFVYFGYTLALHGMLAWWLALPAVALALYSPIMAVLPGLAASFLLMPFPHALGLLDEFRWLVPLFGQPVLYAVLLGTAYLSMRLVDVRMDRWTVEKFLRTEAQHNLERYVFVSIDEPTNTVAVRLAESPDAALTTVTWNGGGFPGAFALIHDGQIVDTMWPLDLKKHGARLSAMLEAEAKSAA